MGGGDRECAWQLPADGWGGLALNYTSGTTGNPKGVVYHHRGAAVNAISNILEWDMPKFATYLWTLPMFHCNGWCFPWTVAARAGVNVCLRKVEAKAMIDAIKEHGVTLPQQGGGAAAAADGAGGPTGGTRSGVRRVGWWQAGWRGRPASGVPCAPRASSPGRVGASALSGRCGSWGNWPTAGWACNGGMARPATGLRIERA